MKNVLIATAVACSLASTALTAGSLPGLASSTASTDWSGFYGGLSGAWADADSDFFYLDAHSNGPHPMSGDIYGAFLGYNIQNGSLVYGGEITYAVGPIGDTPDPANSFVLYNDVLDIKARVGYPVQSALVYGVVSYSTVSVEETYASVAVPLPGFGFGAGVDMMVTNNMFVGFEYMARSVDGDIDAYATVPSTDWDIFGNFATATLRVGMKF